MKLTERIDRAMRDDGRERTLVGVSPEMHALIPDLIAIARAAASRPWITRRISDGGAVCDGCAYSGNAHTKKRCRYASIDIAIVDAERSAT